MDFLIEDLNNPCLNKRRNQHLNNLSGYLSNLIEQKGYVVHTEKRIAFDDFEYSKKCDIYYESMSENRTGIIEIKSISSSFGNNANNRIEELVGQAMLFKNILRVSSVGYVFVYHDIAEKFHYYNRIKQVLSLCKINGLIDHCLLIKVTSKELWLDPDFAIKI